MPKPLVIAAYLDSTEAGSSISSRCTCFWKSSRRRSGHPRLVRPSLRLVAEGLQLGLLAPARPGQPVEHHGDELVAVRAAEHGVQRCPQRDAGRPEQERADLAHQLVRAVPPAHPELVFDDGGRLRVDAGA